MVDGGRLKLEFPVLRARADQRADDYWCEVGGELVGFLGIYQFGSGTAEIAGMVHPSWRRRGIFTALLNTALAELRRRDTPRVLLIVHRGWEPGPALAAKLGAGLEHSEHRMRQAEATAPLAPGEELVIRPVVDTDEDFVLRCLTAAFQSPQEQHRGLEEGMHVIEDASEPVGVMRVDHNSPAEAAIYGFAVLPECQGRGVGRRALVQVTSQLRAEGVEAVSLEVSVENDHALRLYERCGFEALGTEDYYELVLGES
jgi:ribosomal protein S18 acetylase RimI-like enzyme